MSQPAERIAMHPIAPSTSLGELVVAHPAAASLLERLQLDYCCGGARTIQEACAQRGLDAATVIALIESLDDPSDRRVEPHDLRHASISQVCDHIVAAHHAETRQALARIGELAATVVRVHGGTHPELRDVARIFSGLRAELEQHMAFEEERVFPACRAVAGDGGPPALDDGPLALLEDEHELTGESLSALRELCGGYDPAGALCSTHRVLLHALHQLELDTHQHVHEENNVLFPRVRELLAARSA
jgi:regulator of cell morphogenesis and NO signaling